MQASKQIYFPRLSAALDKYSRQFPDFSGLLLSAPKATFTLHRYSFRPLHFCYRSSASTLYRIKTVHLPFPVYTVPDPFDFLLRACAQQVSHCMQGRKFALKSCQNVFNVCLRKRRQLEYVNEYWFCCGSKRLHCAGTLWIRIKTVPVGRIKIVPVLQD